MRVGELLPSQVLRGVLASALPFHDGLVGLRGRQTVVGDQEQQFSVAHWAENELGKKVIMHTDRLRSYPQAGRLSMQLPAREMRNLHELSRSKKAMTIMDKTYIENFTSFE